MLEPSGTPATQTPHPTGTVRVIGAGPIGLLLTALLQTIDGPPVQLYERRGEYTRGRMVSLAPYLVADSIESYQADAIDGESVEAIFDTRELETRLAYRRTIAPDLTALLREWTRGFVPLKVIEQSLSDLIDARGSTTVRRTERDVSVENVWAMLEPGDILVDCTGSRSLLRDHLVPTSGEIVRGQNTQRFRLEYALVITFLYGEHYACDEYCKYYKNVENPAFKFIPSVNRTFYDGDVTHVTGIVSINREVYDAMPPQFDGPWLRTNAPDVAESMDRFIDKIKSETHGELVSELEIVRIPLDVYRAWNATSRRWRGSAADHPLTVTPAFLVGDSAIGSPYFQSISLGFECAFFLAGHIANVNLTIEAMIDRYEAFIYQQWLRVYMRTRMIKHNKDLLESADDTFGLLGKLHVF